MAIKLETFSCTACHACVAMCPKGCIAMTPDEFGFLRPKIDKNLCIECGICIRVCEQTKELPQSADREIYVAAHKTTCVRSNSSSGGVFSSLSDVVLEKSGIIVGACYNEDMSVKHDFAQTKEERDKMRGSKYTYSLCDEQVFRKIKELVDNGTNVMFTGTPCQNAALKAFIGKDYRNLVLVDILCHGITAPVLYRDFVKELEKKESQVSDINFRYAIDGNWHEPKTLVTYKNGRKKSRELENSYFKMFVSDYFLRESCYKCNYASFERVSDITMGDFWGIEEFKKEWDVPYGVSVVLANTEKGKKMLYESFSSLNVELCSEKECTHEQLNGLKEKQPNTEFVKDYFEQGYRYAYKKYVKSPWSIRVREKLYRNSYVKKIRDIIKGT